MTQREELELHELKMRIAMDQGGLCGVCGKPMTPSGTQLAHRIPQRKHLIRMYGKRVIHHRMNMVAVCGLDCNAKVSLGATVPQQEMADRIKEAIYEDDLPF